MNLVRVLLERAEADPEAAALIETTRGRDDTWTFSEVAAASARYADELLHRGIRTGDRVLVLQPMSAELYVLLCALWRSGAVPVFLDPSAGREHVTSCCETIAPDAFVGSRKAMWLRWFVPALRTIPVALPIRARRARAGSTGGAPDDTIGARIEDVAELAADSPALITFTSGSTGRPKAAVRTHGFLAAQYEILAGHLGLAPGQIDLATMPVFVLANLGAGTTTVIPDADLRSVGSIDAAAVVAQIERRRVTRVSASPAFLQRLIEHCERCGIVLTTLETIHTGGGPVFPALLDRLQGVAPVAKITAVYGSTEAEPIASVALDEIGEEEMVAMRGGAGLLAGRPIDEIELRIMSTRAGVPVGRLSTTHFDAACVEAGEAGEIVVRGPHVLDGYLDGRGDEETKFDVDGVRWHRTGDAGRLDPSGRLWLLGRASAKVEDERGELYPFGVECAAQTAAGVARAALVSWRGQRVLAVEPRPTAEAPLESLAGLLEWARLDCIHPTEHIPVDGRHNSKVDYPALERLLARELS